MGDRPAHDLPYHLLRIKLWLVGRQEQQAQSRVFMVKRLERLGVVKTDIVEEYNDRAARIPVEDNFQEITKGLGIAALRNMAQQSAGF